MTKIIKIHPAEEIVDSTPLAVEASSKDWAMVKSMIGLARKKPQHGLVPLELEKITRKTKLALIMLPEWGIIFPPYNLSRLSGVTRAAGYDTTVYDINIKAWHQLKKTAPIDYWEPSREWMWENSCYEDEIHQYLEPIILEFIDRLVADKPDIIGFSLYYTNEKPSNWMAERLRKLLPEALIIAGGPQAISPKPGTEHRYDHLVKGEGEQILINLLDKFERGEREPEKNLVAPRTRLDLDSLPFPDYHHFDLNEYEMPNGISSEISRGCVAKCVFCTEVHFWKYRGRQAGTILDEIEYQYRAHGINFVWFIDSLVNGNLKELRAFALGVVERGLNLQWQGYSRCDGRMDADYFKDLKASGCHQLNYGIESGSQRVLDDMKKGVKVVDIEDNLRHGFEAGILNSTNWIIGFPSEDKQGIADTLTLVWRIRHWLFNVSPGVTMMLSPDSEIINNKEKFSISPYDFQGAWVTNDFSNTKIHRLIRQKSFLILLQHLNTPEIVWGCDRPGISAMHTISYDKNNISNEIPYEEFDYQIINTTINVFADGIVNEIWPLLRTLWLALGPYEITVRFDPTEDEREFGHRITGDYTAEHQFKIDTIGNWSADFKYKFTQKADYNPGNYTWPNYSFTHAWSGTGSW